MVELLPGNAGGGATRCNPTGQVLQLIVLIFMCIVFTGRADCEVENGTT